MFSILLIWLRYIVLFSRFMLRFLILKKKIWNYQQTIEKRYKQKTNLSFKPDNGECTGKLKEKQHLLPITSRL